MKDDITLTVAIECTCSTCGKALTISEGWGTNSIKVDPCDDCIGKAYDSGRDEALADVEDRR